MVRRIKKSESKPTAEKRARAVAGKPEPESEPELTYPNGTLPEEPTETPVTTNDLRIGGSYDRIVETLFTPMGADEMVEEIERFLTLSGKASAAEYGTLVDRLDDAQEMVRQALRVLVTARGRAAAYEVDAATLDGAMYREAENLIAEEIADKDNPRAGKPTKDSIRAMMSTEYHDEVRDLATKRAEAKAMVEYLEGLHKIVGERARDLRQMVTTVRG